MRFVGFASAVCRRTVVTVALGASLCVGSTAWAQAAAAAPAQDDPFKFTADAAAVVWTIKPDKIAGFEEVWAAIRAKLAASDKAELKQLGESLKVYKVGGPVPADGLTYFFIADPASKTTSYNITYLLFQSMLFTRAEADLMFPKIQEAVAGLNAIPFVKVP